MQFILPLIYSLVFVILILRTRFFDIREIVPVKLAGLFVLKLVAAAVLFLLYTYHYHSSDFYVYFTDSGIFVNNLFGEPAGQMASWNSSFDPVLFNNSRVMILVNAFLRIFSFGNIYVHIVFFCFFSFIGLVAIYKAFVRSFPQKGNRLMVAVFLVPTVLFWSSAALKESLAIGLLGLLVWYSDFGLRPGYKPLQVIFTVALFVLLFFVKIYVALALLPPLLVNSIIAATSNRWIIFKYLSVFLTLSILCFYVAFLKPELNVLHLISAKQSNALSEARGGYFLENGKNFICVDYGMKDAVLQLQPDSSFRIRPGSTYMSWKLDNMKDTTFVNNSNDTASYRLSYLQPPAQSVIPLKRLKPELSAYLLFAPEAMMNVIARPTVFDIKSWLHLIVAIENLWILLLIMLLLIFFDKSAAEKKEILFFCLVFSIILFVLIGYTVPSMGAMIRYRIVGLLFFVPMCLLLIDEQRLKRRFRL
jgi:hypothetical protein